MRAGPWSKSVAVVVMLAAVAYACIDLAHRYPATMGLVGNVLLLLAPALFMVMVLRFTFFSEDY